MKSFTRALDLSTLVGKGDLKVSVILLGAAILPAIQRCWGSMEFWARTFGASGDVRAPLFMFCTTFLSMGLIPLLVVRYLFHESPRQYGLRLGNWKLGSLSTIVLAPIIAIALLYPASQTSEMRSFYPFAQTAMTSWLDFLLLELPRVIVFYTAWEFFFRGFILFGLERQFNAWPALCIQVIPQCLWHIGMPTGELLSSIAGGLLFGLMALRTRSIVWPWILHCFIGICTDLMIILTQ